MAEQKATSAAPETRQVAWMVVHACDVLLDILSDKTVWRSATYVLEVCEFRVASGYVGASVETVLVLGDGVEGDDIRGRVVASVVLLCAGGNVGGAR